MYMNGERDKAQKIMQELVSYFLEQKVEDLQMNLTVNREGIWLEIEGQISQCPSDLTSLRGMLEVKRQPEMDDYYEHLMGIPREQEDYSLVGMLVDSAEISYQEENRLLNVRIYRENLY